MYFITTKRMLEVCFSAHPNIQYRTVVYGKMYRFALCEAAPLIIWHGKLQHGWGRFTTILPSRHS